MTFLERKSRILTGASSGIGEALAIELFRENLRVHLKRFLQKEIGAKLAIVTTVVEA